MMRRALLLFSKASAESGRADPAQLAQLISSADASVEASYAFFEDLLFYFSESDVEVFDIAHKRSLAHYDAVYFRFWGDDAKVQGAALAAARFCKVKNIPFIDSEVLREGSFDKISQYMNLHDAGVPFPKALVGPASELLARYTQYGFAFPLILKNASGTRGRDNFLVKNKTEMKGVLQKNSHLTFVLQTYVPNNCDYRVVVMGSDVALIIKRTAKDDTHLNNTSQGGTAEKVPVSSVPKKVRDMSVRAAHFFGCQIAGVDMVQSAADGRWYCFEVNRSPQIEHSSFEKEKAAELAKYLRTLAK